MDVTERDMIRMLEHDEPGLASSCSEEPSWPVMLCLLGNFRLLWAGELVPLRAGGKREALLAHLALQYGRRVPRERLVQAFWPTSELALALNSLNNLVYTLHKLLGPALEGASPVLHGDGYYRLNLEAGIGVDVMCFERLVERGDQQQQAGDVAAALVSYRRAVALYRDDLCSSVDAQTILERERLRARYLTLLEQLAESYYRAGDASAALGYLWRLLARNPYREDAHRLVMRCFVQRGERATALRHYQVCAELLRTEFDAPPEPATVALFDQIRLHPDGT
jgi:DNA-binding SARP family transcriptional activator